MSWRHPHNIQSDILDEVRKQNKALSLPQHNNCQEEIRFLRNRVRNLEETMAKACDNYAELADLLVEVRERCLCSFDGHGSEN